jgi:hypothetical protein
MSEKDFDFVFGDWKIHNRKLTVTTDPDCDEWVEFEARGHAEPILDGFGHVDRMWSDAPPGDDPFEGFTLRLYDPAADVWRIWWSSTRMPGLLDPPVEGRWVDGRGTFECDDVLAGRAVRVRFEWTLAGDSRARWQQSFSYDGGTTWKTNWVMDFSRAGSP